MLVLGGLAMASVTAAPVAEIVLLGATGWREQPQEIAVASGGTAQMELLIPATLDRALLRIDLRQVSGAVTLPFGKPRPLSEFIGEGASEALGITTVRLPVPKLDRKTLMLARIFSENEPVSLLARINLRVYPPTDWTALQTHLHKNGPQLLVFGKEPGLRSFFNARSVAFSDQGEDLPMRLAPGTLMIGLLSARDWAERQAHLTMEGGRLIVFVADADVPPGVYTTSAGGGTMTKVTLPIIPTLARDPRNEDFFLQLIEQHLTPAPPPDARTPSP